MAVSGWGANALASDDPPVLGLKLRLQPEARGSSFVATDDLFGGGLLLPDPRQKGGQLELRVLGLTSSLACDLLSAGLGATTVSICIHSLVEAATSLRVRQHSCHLSVLAGMSPD